MPQHRNSKDKYLPPLHVYVYTLLTPVHIQFIFSHLQVEDAWKTTEFTVLPHRDSKDIFILGGTDEIQVLLDDSQVNVTTISSSRYVGPIAPRVEDWVRNLALFSETLVSSLWI